MKKFWWIALVLVFVLAVPVTAAQVIKIYVNGAELKSDVPAQIINGRTMVPIRAIAEYFGKQVDWDGNTRTVTIKGKSNVDLVSEISKEWSTAPHAKTVSPLAYAGIRDACQPCHSGNGMQNWGTATPYKPGKSFVANPIASDKAYLEKDPNNKKYSYMFDPNAAELPTPMDCATCHAGTGASILKSGTVPATLNVASGGKAEWKVGNSSALCFSCHNGRRDTKTIYKNWADPKVANENVYPHHGWDSLVTGNGMEYPDVKYATNSMHQSLGCAGCHMGKTADGHISHEFKPNIATCNKCHPGQTEFNMGGGLEKELEEKLATLEKLVLAKIPGAVKIGINHSTSPVTDKDGKVIPAKNITSVEALVGAYNWALVTQELESGAKGAHNPAYAKSLLDESIKKLQ